MKIPKYLYEPVFSPPSLKTVARIAQIEAALYRKVGNRSTAIAFENFAVCLERIGRDVSPAQAFDWPKQHATPGSIVSPLQPVNETDVTTAR
jgi:hypothetical protein